MLYRTHVIISVTAAVAISTIDNAPFSAATLAGVAIGSLLPDIDEPNSYIGKRTRGVSDATKFVFGHRGFTHSILAMFLAFIPWFIVSNFLDENAITVTLSTFLFGIALGYIFHILGDMLSKTGVPLFLPFSKKRIKIPLYTTGGTMEVVIHFLSVAILVYFIFKGIGIPETITIFIIAAIVYGWRKKLSKVF